MYSRGNEVSYCCGDAAECYCYCTARRAALWVSSGYVGDIVPGMLLLAAKPY